MVSSEHRQLQSLSSTEPMLPVQEEKKVPLAMAANGVPKILIREDTMMLGGLSGCACGKVQFQCTRMSSGCSLCWGKSSERRNACVILMLATTFVISLLGTVVFCFTDVLQNLILSNMALKEDSKSFRMWEKPSVQPYMKVHIFNYTNIDRFSEGLDDKLKVEDLGPYVYAQSIERVNVGFETESLLTYQQKSSFEYIPEKSVGLQYDQVIVPNLPLLGVVSKAEHLNLYAQMTLAQLLPLTKHPEPFLRLAVHNFTWGYDDTIINVARPFMTFQGAARFDNFGLLASRAGVQREKITVNTGAEDITKLNFIEAIDGRPSLNLWASAGCNSIEATDGSMFPPALLDKRHTLYTFNPNLCRRLPLEYQKDVVTADGIQAYRYVLPMDVFDDPSTNPSNQCYCHIDSAVCPPRGIMNVSTCALGAPILASFPHFLNGDPSLFEHIEGLHPDPESQSTFLDLHPRLGIALNGRSSLQINIQVKKTPQFRNMRYLPDNVILPIAWFEMSVEELPSSIKALVYHGTYSAAAVQMGLSWGFAVALCFAALGLAVAINRHRRRPCVTIKKVSTSPSQLDKKC